MRLLALIPGLLLGLWAAPLWAECRQQVFETIPITACRADPQQDNLQLWLTAPDGRVYGTFERLRDDLLDQGQTLDFVMNGGMYHPDRRPVGLYIEDGQEVMRVVTSDGPGNFGLLPNGVFCLGPSGAQIVESRAFADDPPPCRYATQSGPMLVIANALHPRLLPDSASTLIRNGVGVDEAGIVWLAISDAPVNFHRFARFFRDALGTPNALFLEGRVSRLYARALGRNDLGFPMGPMIGVASPIN